MDLLHAGGDWLNFRLKFISRTLPVGLNAKSCLLEVGSVDRQLPVEAGVQLGGQTLLDQLLLTRCLEEKAVNFLFATNA